MTLALLLLDQKLILLMNTKYANLHFNKPFFIDNNRYLLASGRNIGCIAKHCKWRTSFQRSKSLSAYLSAIAVMIAS